VPARLETSGRPWPGQAPVELAVARIVRECLTNAGRHAAGAEVRLQVDWSSDRVRVTASNPSRRRTVQAGRGLTGIRHRAELLGGTCSVGVTGGRFVVDVCLPRVTAGASS
jgi:signal transduction histidine kinase